MGAPARWLARRHSAREPTYQYYFSYVGSFRPDSPPGAPHGDIDFYTFDNLAAIWGKSISPQDGAMERTLHAAWIAFARVSRPTVPGRTWPAYTQANDTLLDFGPTVQTIAGLRQREYDAIEAAKLPQILPAP
jgi:carboxylesterase type B